MMYHPSTKIDFGLHKGFEISKIYQYDPSYLEWAIKFVLTFEVDIAEFEKLPTPTPHGKTMSVYEITDSNYGYSIDSVIPKAEMYVEAGNQLKEINFIFSEFSKEALSQKKDGTYNCPEYEKVKLSTVKTDDLF